MRSKSDKASPWRQALTRAASFALLLLAGGLAQAADTTQDFLIENFPLPPPVDRFQLGGDARVAAGGWDGNFMQLTRPVGGLLGTAFFEQVFTGPYVALELGFQLRVSEAGNGGADGFGFSYLNTANYGPGNNPIFGEEPSLAGSLGVGFDTFNNADLGDGGEGSVSLHFGSGPAIGSRSLDGIFALESGLVIDAGVSITPDGLGNSRVTVALSDGTTDYVAFDNVLVPGMTPYNGRAAFGARTGGAWNRQAIDNVQFRFTPDVAPGGGPIQAGAGAPQEYSEDFEVPVQPEPTLVGGALYGAQGHNIYVPQVITDGAVGVRPGVLRLTQETNDNSSGSIAFDQTSTETNQIRAQFDVKIRDVDTTGSADGLQFMLLDAADYGTTGNTLPAGFIAFDSAHLANSLGITFDTYYNPDQGETLCTGCAGNKGNSISVSWNGLQIIDQNIALADVNLTNGNVTAFIAVDETVGGSLVSVTVVDNTDGSTHDVISNFLVPGVVFDGGARAAFGARTGGASDFHELDNVSISFAAIPEPSSFVLAAFGLVGVLAAARRKRRA